MANIGNFDATQVAPRTSPDPLPTAWYNGVMTSSEVKATGDNEGAYLLCEYTVIDGPYAGRKVYDRLNMHNKNETAVRIAYESLSAICHAVGVLQLNDSQALHNRPLQIKVVAKPAREGFDASNDVKGYRSIAEGQSASATQAPAFSPPTAAAPMFAPPAAAIAPPAPAFAQPTFAPPAQAQPAFAPPTAAPAFAPPAQQAFAPPAAAPAFGGFPVPGAAPAPAGDAAPPWARQG